MDKDKFFIIKISLIIGLSGNFFFLLMDTLGKTYRKKYMLITYWIIWVVLFVLFTYSHIRNKPNWWRFLHFIMIIRQTMPWLNFEDRTTFDDVAVVVRWSMF